MHQHYIALKSYPNRDVGRKDGESVSSAMTGKARCGRVQWKALTKRDVRQIGKA